MARSLSKAFLCFPPKLPDRFVVRAKLKDPRLWMYPVPVGAPKAVELREVPRKVGTRGARSGTSKLRGCTHVFEEAIQGLAIKGEGEE